MEDMWRQASAIAACVAAMENGQPGDYLIILFRIISIMILLLAATLFVMGKRPIGELPVFDFLVLVVMGAIVGADIADPEIRHLPTAFAIIVLAGIQRLSSFLALRYRWMRKLITFEPTVVLHDGKLVYSNIKRIHYSVDEILMMLREREVYDHSKVEYGIIEPNGELSLLKKPCFGQVTPRDLNLACAEGNLAVTVIYDGRLQYNNLCKLKLTEEDILRALKANGIADVKDAFHASMDENGKLNVSTYHENANDIFSSRTVP